MTFFYSEPLDRINMYKRNNKRPCELALFDRKGDWMRGAANTNRLRKNIPLLIMLIPVIAYYLIFKYGPMGGLVIAFKNYSFSKGIWGSQWVGLANFQLLFRGANTLNIIRNTFVLSVLRLIWGFPFPILLALMLNEVRSSIYKRTLQTILYIPHFFSWVIVGGIVTGIFAQETGIVNQLITAITGGDPIPLMYRESSWTAIYIGSGIWKEAGFGTIIYLSALTAIDPALYESAVLDGANKLQQILYITLPCIKSVIFMQFILATGNIMDVGFDQIYTLQNNAVFNVADVISTYVYRIGLQGVQFSMATAMGLFESLVGLILVVTANRLAKHFGENLW